MMVCFKRYIPLLLHISNETHHCKKLLQHELVFRLILKNIQTEESINNMSSNTKFCPVLRPSFNEFIHFNTYIKSIENILREYGIVKVQFPYNISMHMWLKMYKSFHNSNVSHVLKIIKSHEKSKK